MKFILGLKLSMSRIFDKEGRAVPVTLIEAGPCQITQIKTKAKDGYETVQIGFFPKKKKIKKTEKGKEFRYLREFKGEEDKSSSSPFAAARVNGDYKLGDKIDVSIFQEGDIVKVSGISKGKGFAGVVKRWGFAGRSRTHGTKHELRAPGSVGSTFPQRVVKGKKLAGRMGAERVTVKNLKIVRVDPENNLIAVRGAVPGRKGTLLEIRG
jgi:large subunit ribosomal protein L3